MPGGLSVEPVSTAMSKSSFAHLGVVSAAPEKWNAQPPPPTATGFTLVGESFLARDTIEDMFCPRFLLYPYPMRSIPGNQDGLDSSYGSPVNHLDITKTWKGLSSGQAEELIFWENLFRKVLSDLLHNQLDFLCQEIVSFACEGRSPLCNRGDDEIHYVPIRIIDIVLAMVERFKNTNRRYRWFFSTGNLYIAVAQFVRTHDCFTGGYQDYLLPDRADNLRIGVKLGEPDLTLSTTLSQPTDIVAQVVWNPGYLCFEEFDLTPKEGGEFCLTPTYNPPFITPSTMYKASVRENITYSTSACWLRWDSQTQCFCGTVPYLSEVQQQLDQGQDPSIVRSRYQRIAYTLLITVRAIVTEHLDEKVRFEQSIRARITINVAPSWTFEGSPRLVNDLYSPEKGDVVNMREGPLSPSKLHLSEKPGGLYGGIYDHFHQGAGDRNCSDVQCFSCLFPSHPEGNTQGHNPIKSQESENPIPSHHDVEAPGHIPFIQRAPENQDSQNERSSGSDTLGNSGTSKSGICSDFPLTSHNSLLWDYRVLTPEGTMKKRRGPTVRPRYGWSGVSAAQDQSFPTLGPKEPDVYPGPGSARPNDGTMKNRLGATIPPKYDWFGPSTAQGQSSLGQQPRLGYNEPASFGSFGSFGGIAHSSPEEHPFTKFDGNASGLEARYAPLQSQKYSSLRGIDQFIQPDIGRHVTDSTEHIAREPMSSSDESNESIAAAPSLDSSNRRARVHTDSGYGSAPTKLSDDEPENDMSANKPISKIPGGNVAEGSPDLYPGNSESNIGSFATAGSDRTGRSADQQGGLVGIGAIGDEKARKYDRARRIKVASDEAVKVVNSLTLPLQGFREDDFKKPGNPWLVHQEKKAEFVQMLRRMSQQEQEPADSDMEDIFFCSSSDSSDSSSESEEVTENADRGEGVLLHAGVE